MTVNKDFFRNIREQMRPDELMIKALIEKVKVNTSVDRAGKSCCILRRHITSKQR